MVKKNTNDGLLTFDEDSPLFVKKKKTTRKRKLRTTTPVITEDVVQVEEAKPKRRRKRQATKPINANMPKYIIKSPADCKHILPAFKKLLVEKWKTLETGNGREIGDVANYIRGVAAVAKEKRPKEYEELRVLIALAKQIATEVNS